jgi:hypothetical protein
MIRSDCMGRPLYVFFDRRYLANWTRHLAEVGLAHAQLPVSDCRDHRSRLHQPA